MADFFIEPEDSKKPAKPAAIRKTKKQQSAEEYEKVCARMAELRARRKGLIKPSEEELAAKKEKAERAAAKKLPVKEIVKEVVVEKIVEKPVEKIVEKIVEKPVEVIKEVVKEIPAPKQRASSLFLDEDEIIGSLRELKSWMSEMRVKPADASRPTENIKKEPETPKVAEKPKEPETYIFTGVKKGFRRVY